MQLPNNIEDKLEEIIMIYEIPIQAKPFIIHIKELKEMIEEELDKAYNDGADGCDYNPPEGSV